MSEGEGRLAIRADHYVKERLCFGAKEELKRRGVLFSTTAVGSMRKLDEDFPAKSYAVGDYLDFSVPTLKNSYML